MSKNNDYRIVRIVVRANDYDRFKTVKISNFCPICKSKRGDIFKGFAYDGSERFEVDCWKNECGHVDMYNRVYEEACNNGMNPQLEKGLSLKY